MAQPLPHPTPDPAVPVAHRPRRWPRRLALGLAALLLLALVAVAAGALWLRARMGSSLPQLDGRRAVAGLAGEVSVERDALGVPTVRAGNRLDAARALGFLHGQDRFFQMDLMRRQPAGELSELFGGIALDLDKSRRVHRFRHVAARTIASATPGERAVLQAYADGVNAGVAALAGAPFEYGLLRVAPAPWKPEDSILVVLAMFQVLHDEEGRFESDLGLMRDLLSAPMLGFLAPVGTEWDAPLVGQPFRTPSIPGPQVFDLRQEPRQPEREEEAAALEREPAAALGSNNWAVAGTHTADGRAWLANDMHLPISVPNTWYRASLVWRDEAGGERRVTGVTLPGTPAVAVGSNGFVSWGFTNSYGDWYDLIELETDPRQPDVYRTPAGPRRFEVHRETVRVKGGEDVTVEVRSTIWGPVLDADHRGRLRAYAWTAHHPQAVNLRLMELEGARNLEEALDVANRSGAPPQNFVVADRAGRIAWTIMGRMPRRVGFDGRTPSSWADGTRRWDGWLTPAEMPRVVDPPSGRVWTANSRVVDGEMLAKLGDGGYDLGARARQIRDGLLRLPKARPEDLLAIQLDDRALYLETWRRHLLADVLTPQAVQGNARRAEMRRLIETGWTGRASVDSAGYRMVRAYRNTLADQVFGALTARCQRADEDFIARLTPQNEGPLWKMVRERPVHLLDPRFQSWDEQFLAAVDEVLDHFGEMGGTLADRTWGERNTPRIGHPLGGAVPLLGRWVNVPARPLPGDEDMPRVQAPGFGASERLVVSPGQEEKGFFHMPVGQSGNPRSPFYRNGHAAWEEGRPTPFLPGPAEHRLTLAPGP